MISFNISQVSQQGLGSSLQTGECSVERDLALVGDLSGKWTLIDTRREKAPNEGVIIKGAALSQLMHAAADNEKGPIKIEGRDFKDLTHNSKFRNFCRMIPGMESEEHHERRTHSTKAKTSMYETAKLLGKGLLKMEAKGVEGHYVGFDQESHDYWMREIVFRDTPKPAREVEILVKSWKSDRSSNLSLKDWEAAKKEEWKKSKSDLDFLPWIAKNTWEEEQKKAWHEAHPNELFDQTKFDSWNVSQTDPILMLPKWLLQKKSKTKTEGDFDVWRNNMIQERKEIHRDFIKVTGVDISFEDHERLEFEHSHSGSVDNSRRWILQQIWTAALTSDDFPTFIRRQMWEKARHEGKTDSPFEEWCKCEDRGLHSRYEGSHLPVSYKDYKMQQDDGILAEPAPFVSLDKDGRKAYLTTCTNGKLDRNGAPLNTEFEKTLNSGPGYAIFVIGPDDDLYCGSHIGGVFHHSSFLADQTVAAAGEIKTNKEGRIIELSSKSGHYRPRAAQILYMLRYFKDRGSDLNFKFTAIYEKGRKEERNAKELLAELESSIPKG